VARRDARLERRLVLAALWRQRGSVALAVMAVAIGASVAAALMHLSSDIGRKLTHELRALGPNLLLVPGESGAGAPAAPTYLDAAEADRRLAEAHVNGACLLYVAADAEAGIHRLQIPVIGAPLARLRALHPSWRVEAGTANAMIGARLAARLGATASRGPIALRCGTRTLLVAPAWRLQAGGADDDALWIPLEDAQQLAGLPGRASLAQARVDDPQAAKRATALLERGGGMHALVLHALSETEAGLLARMRRLMALVTAAALLAAGLCAFGTLTDLALERRRDIALIKSLGASRGDVVRLFVSESLAIGLLGGLAGWVIGVGFAELIGGTVFHAGVALRPDVPAVVIALSVAVASLAGLGPIGLALAIEPAAALKGD
jgi:putative ABC transport system permease protein